MFLHIYPKDPVTTVEESGTYNFQTIPQCLQIFESKETLLMTLENEWEKTIEWFKLTMSIDPGKFQSMIPQKSGNIETYTIYICWKIIETVNSIKLVAINVGNTQINVDNTQTFDHLVSDLDAKHL